MLDALSEKKIGELVGASLSLELAFGLSFVPYIDIQVPDICGESFGCHRAGRYSSIGTI